MKVGFMTLGCKVNQYETQVMMDKFLLSGFDIGEFDQVCDVYVINTCSVTAESDRKGRQMIRRAKKHNSNAIVCVCGCFSQTSPEKVIEIEQADIIIGSKNKAALVEKVKTFIDNRKRIVEVDNILKEKKFEDMSIKNGESKTRAVLKVEDGCSNFCSYCIIPYAKGPVRSKPVLQAVAEANVLAQKGFEEIVLVGIHLASYGKDLENINLVDLICEIEKIEGIKRIRLGSLEPLFVNETNIKRLKNVKKLCPHFHLSLQSGCDDTLKRMNRRYTTQQYEYACELIRANFENPAITTDIMVGFPGESSEEFEKSYNFVNKINFASAHVFMYSKRKNTPAENMPCQVSQDDKKIRSEKMIELCAKNQRSFEKSLVNTKQEVLIERQADGYFEGYSTNYVPVYIKSDSDICGKIVCAQVCEYNDNICIGKIIDKNI